jgi:hypothetical protein
VNLEIYALVVPGALDLEAARRVIRDVDPMDLVWGFDGSPGGAAVIGAEEQSSPWEDDRMIELSDFAADGALEGQWNSISADEQERFRSAVRWSAERWLEAVIQICRQEDRWFETSRATWVQLDSGGRLLLCPQNSDGFDQDALYGDLFVEGNGRYYIPHCSRGSASSPPARRPATAPPAHGAPGGRAGRCDHAHRHERVLTGPGKALPCHVPSLPLVTPRTSRA